MEEQLDKEKEINTYNHSVSIIERKSMLITGVKKVESFDNEEFLIETIMGYLAIKGENLELIKLDNLQGSLTIKGVFNSMDYFDDNVKKEGKTSLISRLFK